MAESFWNFSNAVYSKPGVQDECLHLQDYFGLDVSLVLFCAFVGAVHGISLTETDIAAAQKEVFPWHEEVVKTLRVTRRSLKAIELRPDWPFADQVASFREQIKAAELESELVEHKMLEAFFRTRIAAHRRHIAQVAIMTNLQLLVKGNRIASEQCVVVACMKQLLIAALEHSPQSAGTRQCFE